MAKNGVIVLHQFPRAQNSPNPSPYPLKVETFLRMNNLNYETGKIFTRVPNVGLK